MVNAMSKDKNIAQTIKTLPWPAVTASAYAAAVLVWLPWYATGYLQIAQDKLAGFLGITILAGVLLAAVAPEKTDISRLKRQETAAVVYAAAVLVSVLLSGNIPAALWASGGYLGGFVLAAGALLGCMGTAVFLKNPACLTVPFLVSGTGVTLLGIVNNFGVDPLGFRVPIQASQYNLFFSTVGNADYLSAFLCLWLPLALYTFAAGRGTGERIIAFVCAEIGFLGMASLDSGLCALGLAGAAFLLLLFVPLSAGQLSCYALLTAGWVAAQFVMGQLSQKWPLLRTEHPFAALAKPVPAAVVVAVCLSATVLFAALAKKKPAQTCLTAQRILCAAVAAAAAIAALLANRAGIGFGGLDNFLRIGPDWATGRGAIWADVWYCFVHGTPLQILFGRGPGMVYTAMHRAGAALPYPLADTIGAHNEYLELLLTTGVVGLAAYLGFLYCTLRTACARLTPEKRGWLFCAAAYLVQAFFNNRVAAVFPLFMVLLGVLCAENQEPDPRTVKSLLPVSLALAAVGIAVGRILLHYLYM